MPYTMAVMMTTVALALLLLLAAPAVTLADCAWVLWNETPPGSGRFALASTIQVTFDTKAACERAARAIDDAQALSTDEAGTRGQQVPALFLLCLPDTIDPRGPKAK
jgi:hypothetical protein